MKKLAFFVLSTWVFSMFFVGLAGLLPVAAENVDPGTLIKGRDLSTVYFLGSDGKRYVFPNAKTYFSWYDDFGQLEEIDDDELMDYPLGGNVRYKPGRLLVKIQTDPKVYAVSHNGHLRWIMTETIARALYGENWNTLIDDVPDSFFTNYEVDDPIEDEDEYDPDDEEEEVDDIDINLGFKAKHQLATTTETKEERRCQRLQRMVNRVQGRFARWDVELPDNLGSDFLDECMAGEDEPDDDLPPFGKKVDICHVPDEGIAHTITVSLNAVKAHILHGDDLGACAGDGDEEPDEDDTTPPIISGLNVAVTATTAVITWTTDEAADGELKVSTDPLDSGGTIDTFEDITTSTSHTFKLSQLTPETLYYYEVGSEDANGNQAEEEGDFTTLAEDAEEDITPPVISNVVVKVDSATATVSYTTDELSDSKIVFATESLHTALSPIEVSESTLVTEHVFDLFDLATSTEYFFRLESADADSNLATTTEDSFTTLE